MAETTVQTIKVWLYVGLAGAIGTIVGFVLDYNERNDVDICKAYKNLDAAAGSPSFSDLVEPCQRSSYIGLVVLVVGLLLLVGGVVGVALTRTRRSA